MEADLFHHLARSHIGGHREGNDFLQTKTIEAVGKYRTCSFSRVTLPPVSSRQSPTNLDSGHEMRFETRDAQAREADEVASFLDFHCIKTVPVRLEMIADPLCKGIRLFSVQSFGQKFAYLRTSVHLGKRRQISLLPFPEDKALCINHGLKINFRLRPTTRLENSL